ncbi:MAG: hypothetical protein EG822_02510 [Deltaproteobacteria bacterium]|nr:hypothetical protein [Deltaproteobacteria bacterium]TLN04319.1 MAG: hypothetical protein FDZ73_04415 [bacterium]
MIHLLIDVLLVTVAEANGLAFATPQVYESLRVFIITSRPKSRNLQAPTIKATALLNPELVWQLNKIRPQLLLRGIVIFSDWFYRRQIINSPHHTQSKERYNCRADVEDVQTGIKYSSFHRL